MAKLMLRTLALLFVTALVAVGCQTWRNGGQADLPPPPRDALRIATYNVHYIVLNDATGAWSRGDWERRKDPLAAAVAATGADVIAFQEMESFQRGSDGSVNLARDHLLAELPQYAAAADGPWETFPPTQPIFYRADRLRVLDEGWFFFSDTPDRIYSRTFDGGYPAFASWARLTDRTTGKSFRVVNIHTDYASYDNRAQSLALVAERIAPWQAAGETVFVTGDFNARLGSDLHAILEDRGLSFAPVEGATYHFDRGINLFGAIDHLAYTRGVGLAGGPWVLRRQFLGEWPTDHYPVVTDVTLP
ncbi:Metal-dependent hydrolase, endonuclease/exonuclease/phosphatase family [Palleronia salina]|uniref:Metal-dependent hydrolase, endonuclease/exonuclease/phosphatase family n=1 Tax=Palleronia salina TaxID=313368 RepID=A0A1M6DDY5_9RHOB|nr:endonuclease/exonuclease/phosphatase family protein [Palleronia salina]SHI71261.1 Metal-dependent hydrolase, endonuclease/exonuclease/phosphatase family [Palleronia salina]